MFLDGIVQREVGGLVFRSPGGVFVRRLRHRLRKDELQPADHRQDVVAVEVGHRATGK